MELQDLPVTFARAGNPRGPLCGNRARLFRALCNYRIGSCQADRCTSVFSNFQKCQATRRIPPLDVYRPTESTATKKASPIVFPGSVASFCHVVIRGDAELPQLALLALGACLRLFVLAHRSQPLLRCEGDVQKSSVTCPEASLLVGAAPIGSV